MMKSLLNGLMAINNKTHGKKQIKEEFLPITWYDWGIQENEKKRDKEMLALIKRGYLCRFGEYHIAVFAI